jgi:hypothetical protein
MRQLEGVAPQTYVDLNTASDYGAGEPHATPGQRRTTMNPGEGSDRDHQLLGPLAQSLGLFRRRYFGARYF